MDVVVSLNCMWFFENRKLGYGEEDRKEICLNIILKVTLIKKVKGLYL